MKLNERKNAKRLFYMLRFQLLDLLDFIMNCYEKNSVFKRAVTSQ